MKLLNLKQLAGELGVGYSFTKAMRRAGLPLLGGRVLADDAIKWLRKNPDFSPGKARGLPPAVPSNPRN